MAAVGHIPNTDGDWFEHHAPFHRQNGYLSPPTHIYRGFLPLIRQSGRVLDLGCGNGLLLRYLLEHAGQDLLPYGVDLDAATIEVARTIILPAHADNFWIGDVRDRPPDGAFDIVLTNPIFVDPGFHNQTDGIIHMFQSDGSIRAYIEHCIALLRPGGDLILYAYEEEYRRVANFDQVFSREVNGLDLEHSVAELGRAAYWVLSDAKLAAHRASG